MSRLLPALLLLSTSALADAPAAVQRLEIGNRISWYLMFKDEGHGFAKKPNSDYFGAAQMLFWQKYLLDE